MSLKNIYRDIINEKTLNNYFENYIENQFLITSLKSQEDKLEKIFKRY